MQVFSRKNMLLSVLCATSLESKAWASKMLPPFETYLGTRSAGMAGASAAVADDENAIFSNPAGIGQEDEPSLILRGFSVPNISLGIDRKAYKFLGSIESGSNNFKQVENLFSPEEKSALFFRGTTFPYVTVGRVQMGILMDATAQATQVTSNDVSGATWDRSLHAWQRSQGGLVAGFSVPHRDSGISAGLTARYAFRTSYFEDVNITGATIDRTESRVNRTRGLAIDGGLLIEPSQRYLWLPGLGISVRDVGNTVYKGTGAADEAEIEKSNLMVAARWKLVPGKKSDTQVLFTVEGHHLNDSRVPESDKLRIGSEIRLGERAAKTPFAFRVGHNMRGFSYGGSIDLLILRLEAGSMVEGIPTAAGTFLDRRNFVRLSVDLRN